MLMQCLINYEQPFKCWNLIAKRGKQNLGGLFLCPYPRPHLKKYMTLLLPVDEATNFFRSFGPMCGLHCITSKNTHFYSHI